jgi:hypothetical protein
MQISISILFYVFFVLSIISLLYHDIISNFQKPIPVSSSQFFFLSAFLFLFLFIFARVFIFGVM